MQLLQRIDHIASGRNSDEIQILILLSAHDESHRVVFVGLLKQHRAIGLSEQHQRQEGPYHRDNILSLFYVLRSVVSSASAERLNSFNASAFITGCLHTGDRRS